jgi:hypothetical protein
MILVVPMFLCFLSYDGLAETRSVRERAAKKACLVGDTTKGVEILADLFIEFNDLTYIYNQGRCFEQNRRYEDAIGRFREFLIKGQKLEADERVEAERHITACQSYLGKARTNQPTIQASPKVVTVVPPIKIPSRVPSPEPTIGVISESKLQSENDNSGSGMRIAGLIVGGLGIAGVATGAVFNLKSERLANKLEEPENFSRSSDHSRRDYKTVAWISYGVGAAFVFGGTLMYYLGWKQGQEVAPAVTVLPMAATNMIGTQVTGVF